MSVTLVAAVAENGVIGRDGAIPWHLPADQAHFKALTLGHVLVMGRRTYDSIGRALPGRTTVVVTRQSQWTAPGVVVCHSVDDALELDPEVFVVGGSAVYAAALPHASDMVLSQVEGSFDGDTYLPSYDRSEWREVTRQECHAFTIIRLQRVTKSTSDSAQSAHGKNNS
jgi:dihydrofolate reductase